jgi:hypothetical protein
MLLVASVPFAAAQTNSAVTGVVVDETGLVLPGVTVEASSPALIEKMRMAVTDDRGVYKIADLRAGMYVVTFSLPGFTTLRREQLELTAAFTATVNVQLVLGTLGEQITVVGTRPLLDVQNVVQGRVVTREVIDLVPTGNRSWAALAMLVPGAKVSGGANVGGTTSAQAAATIHGSRLQESMMLFDGMRYNQGVGTGGVRNAISSNDGNVEQISFATAALSAESEVGGFVHNIIPKEGGNRFAGSFATNYSGSGFQWNNLSVSPADGALSPDSIRKTWDFNPAVGGPVVKDRLWFFSAYRNWGYERQVANRFFNQTPTGLTYIPDLQRPAIDYQQKIDRNLRLTQKLTSQTKVSAYYANQADLGDYRYGNRLTSPEALTYLRQNPNYMAQARWSRASASLLYDAGFTFVNNDFLFTPNLANEQSLPGITELRTGVIWRNPVGTWGHNASHQMNLTGSVSHVSGSHTIKVGGLFLRANVNQTQEAVADGTSWRFLDGRPSAIVVFATPLRFRENLNAQIGAFVQDQWRIERLTLNLGLRFDSYNASVPEQNQGAGPWTPTRDLTFPEVKDVPNWRDVMPRLGASYDVFGNGRTALKATVSKYVFGPEIITYTRLANPSAAIATSATRTWNDVNGDFEPQESELGPISARDFGTPRITQRYDPDVNDGWGKRGANWEISSTVDHQLTPGVTTSVAYYRRWWKNLTTTRNTALNAGDFNPYCVTAPLDDRLPGGGGNSICGFYDVTPTKFGLIDNVIAMTDTFGEQRDAYDGVDLSLNVRLPKGATVAGGTNTERFTSNFCFSQDDPSLTPSTLTSIVVQTGRSLLDCDVKMPWQTQFKMYGVYPLPWAGLTISAAFQSQPGPEITATYSATNAQIAPSLGRNLSAGATGTATVQLIPASTMFGERFNQLDLRLTKTIKVSALEMQGTFDLYNVVNANTTLTHNTTYGPAWLRPTSIMVGRLAKLGLQVRF